MELLMPHDPGEGRTRRCHHHRPRSCCPTGPPTHPGQQRSPTVSITVCWWPSPRCPTRVAAVPDPRDPRGTRYPLVSMLAVAVCAVLAGACTFAAITDWVRDLDRPAWGRLGFTDRVPAATTVQGYCVVGLLLVTASMRSCGRWLARLVARAMLVSPLLRW